MIRDWIASERRGLAGLLAGLSAEQWDAPSLCGALRGAGAPAAGSTGQ